jgi:putative membrane protein
VKKMSIVPVAAALLIAGTVAAPAKEPPSTISSSTQFMKKAATGGMAEVDLGKLAAERGSSPAVKHFGEHMVSDHTKANEDLETVAAKKNVTLPTQLDPKEAAMRDKLAKESGKDFDRAYMKAMVSDHKVDVLEFERASKSSDPDVKQFAVRTLPTLKEHLKEAKSVEASL